MPAMANDTEPFLSAYHFNYTQRPRRDKAWALAYYLLLLLTLGWALINLVLRPDLVAILSSPDYLDDPDHCPITLTKAPASGTAALITRATAAAREAITPAARRQRAITTSPTASTLLYRSTESRDPHTATTSTTTTTTTTSALTANDDFYGRGDKTLLWEGGKPESGVLSSVRRQSQQSIVFPNRQDHNQQQQNEQQDNDLNYLNHPLPARSFSKDLIGQSKSSSLADQGLELNPISSSDFDLGDSGVHSTVQAASRLGKKAPKHSSSSDDSGGSDDDGSSGGGSSDDGPLPRVLLDYGGLLLLLSLGAAVVLAFLFVLALRRSPWALVLLACGLQVGAPLASAVVASKAGNSLLALVLLLAAAALAIFLFCGREALGLASRLLGLAAVALRANSALLGLVAALKMALAGATALLLVAAAVVGAAGDVVPNPLRGGKAGCVSPAGQRITCCALAPSAALPAYLTAASIAMAWTLLLLFELKVYVVSGVVAQWYFSPVGHLAGGGHYFPGGGGGGAAGVGGVGGYSSGRALAASLGHALGPSFGSLCAASGVLGATSYVRAAVNGIMSHSRRNHPAAALTSGWGTCATGLFACLGAVLDCCCCCLVTLLEQLTKFATVQMSMSGLGFWRASEEAVALLRRNFMDAYIMWWYMPMVLHCGAAAFAGAWGYAAYWLARQCWAPFTHAAPLSTAAAVTLGALAAATAELVLSFVCSVLVNISDALFICFVLDRDSAAVTWYDLHCVLASLPCCASADAGALDTHFTAGLHHGGGYGSTVSPPSYYYVPPAPSYGGAYGPYGGYQAVSGGVGGAGQFGHSLGFGQQQQRPQYGGAGGYGGGGGGFWGWLRSPGSSGSGMYGMPYGSPGQYRNDRPQYPPPAVLSPPYSDQRFPLMAPPPPPPPFFGSPLPSARRT